MALTNARLTTSTQSMVVIKKLKEGSEEKNIDEVRSSMTTEEVILSNTRRFIKTSKDRIQVVEAIDNKYHSNNQRSIKSSNLCLTELSPTSSNNYRQNQGLHWRSKKTGSRPHSDWRTFTVQGCFIHKVRLKIGMVIQALSHTMVLVQWTNKINHSFK